MGLSSGVDALLLAVLQGVHVLLVERDGLLLLNHLLLLHFLFRGRGHLHVPRVALLGQVCIQIRDRVLLLLLERQFVVVDHL